MRRILAILILAAGGFFSYLFLFNAEAPPPVAPVSEPVAEVAPVEVEVFIAKNNLREGVFLRADDIGIALIEGTEATVRDNGYFSPLSYRVEDLSGAMMRTSARMGQALQERMISLPGGHGFIAASVRPGMRAVVIPITDGDPGANHLFPGDYVDVILTGVMPKREMLNDILAGKSPAAGGPFLEQMLTHTGTILEAVRVLAVDGDIQGAQPDDLGVPRNPVHITLEVTPKQAEKLVVARRFGNLFLSLRPPEHPADIAARRKKQKDKSIYEAMNPAVRGEFVNSAPSARDIRVLRGGASK